jgi:hypothetical protein
VIKELHLQHVGPAPRFDIEFAERLNILTGDNGLGKTFLLDVAWWALTGTWAGEPAWPQRGAGAPAIDYRVMGKIRASRRSSRFDVTQQFWPWQGEVGDLPGLFIYARADGGFSVSDDARNRRMSEDTFSVPAPKMPAAFHFTPDTLWNGLEVNGHVMCNGLIDDWTRWQYMPSSTPIGQPAITEESRNTENMSVTTKHFRPPSPFTVFTQVLKQLSPHPGEMIEPGKPTRVSLADVRDIPTIDLPYGNVALTHASAGMKRVISLAYLLVWAWYEHQQAAFFRDHLPTDRLVLLIDEVESHLHPRWQRSIVPALLDVATALNPHIQTQIITTTHSPLVLASVEPSFDEQRDQLVLFDLQENHQVRLREIPWSKQGDTVNWLVSDVFGLQQARSKEAEAAIEAAEALMRGEEMSTYPEHLRTREDIHAELIRLLPGHDPFWPRWIVTAQVGAS